MKTFILSLGLVLSSLSFAGNLERLTEGYSAKISSQVTNKTHAFVGCPMNEVTVKGQDPLTRKERKLTLKDYRPPFKGDKTNLKTILLLPPTGGENILDNVYANHLCIRGFRVVILVGWDFQDEASLDPAMHDRGAIRAVAAMRNAIDFIKPTAGQLGIMGTSVGGISASLVMGLDNRVAAGFFIVAGGGMVDIIAKSSEEHLAKFREERLKAYHLADVNAYRDFLSDKITLDPLEFAANASDRPTHFVVANQDITVPTENQVKLLEAFKAKEVTYLDGNHFKVILKTSATMKSTVKKFFAENLQ